MLFIPQIAEASGHEKRRGVILIVVLSLLSIFAVVGLSFVYYADAEATSSRTMREASQPTRADIDPETLLAFGLGQFNYDTFNEYSALRGHSLVRSSYGGDLNNPTIPFNGVG